MKPENIFLDKDFVLKIADFGFAGPIGGKDEHGKLRTKCGTLNYMAPEIHLGESYDGGLVDIFAAGIIMFIMVSAHPAFGMAKPSDQLYRCLAAGKYDTFWNVHGKNKQTGSNFYSNEFKDLF